MIKSKLGLGFLRKKKCYTFIFVVCCHGERDIMGAYSLQESEEKVIINHIYDAVREPT